MLTCTFSASAGRHPFIQDIRQRKRTKTARKRVAIDNVYAYLSYVQTRFVRSKLHPSAYVPLPRINAHKDTHAARTEIETV